jgi:CheY-like chemotaxis protein
MKSILILKSATDSLSDIESFLTSRGFQIKTVTNAREAIQFITEERPTFALLSADLLPQRRAWLFGILSQLTYVVIFVNRVTARNISITRELNGAYLLEPPVNPQGLDQILRRIERESSKQNALALRLNDTQVGIMSALAELSLGSICIPGQAKPDAIERVRRTTRMVCLRVETAKLSGFFVLAYGQNRILDSEWLSHLRSQFNQYLSAFGDSPRLGSPEELEIREVDFTESLRGKAEFILQSLHENSELVMAFFKDPMQIAVASSIRSGYFEMSLDQIPDEAHFDVYVYLPQNARFVLCHSGKEKLSQTKKNKLFSQGIRTVHISKRSLALVRRHQVQKMIQDDAPAPQTSSGA